MDFEVYIDESGLFIETSTDPKDRIAAHKQARKFKSQLAGVLFKLNTLNENSAEAIIRESCQKSGVNFNHGFHANEIRENNQYSEFVSACCNQFNIKNIQPFRIVNEEQLSFGDRVSNYTNVLAELLIRICHTLAKSGYEEINLHVTAAKVVLDEDEKGEIHFMEKGDYQSRIHEYFARAAVRKGYSHQTRNWKVKAFRIGSARVNKVLQLCDIVSNASHDNFLKCDSVAKENLQHALGAYDWTLSHDVFFEDINQYTSLESYGLALILMAQRAIDVPASKDDDLFTHQLDTIVRSMGNMPATAGLSQLQVVVNWLQQGIENRSDLEFSVSAAEWIRDCLKNHAVFQKKDELLANWLNFVITSLLITAKNHLGKTKEASNESVYLDSLIPVLAGRWEYSSDIMHALIAQAVHLNDCFEHQKVVKNMELVSGFYQTLSGFFKEAYPGMFPEEVKSDICGQALGTKLQSQTFLALQNKIDIDEVRNTSDEAIRQFALEDDKRRQYQYRSEVEAIAQDWEEARRFLSMSLGLEDCSHDALAEAINRIESSVSQGFAFLHWTRLGGMAAAKAEQTELDAFMKAMKKQRFLNHPWVQGQYAEYPTHGILRRMAVANAANNDRANALKYLNRLHKITEDTRKQSPIFNAILIAALVQVAGVLYQKHSKDSRNLLTSTNSQKPGALQAVNQLIEQTSDSHPAMATLFSEWDAKINSVLSGDADPDSLIVLGSQIGY